MKNEHKKQTKANISVGNQPHLLKHKMNKEKEKEKKPLNEFLNEASEIHALWFGFYSAWFKLRTEKLSEELKEDIKQEFQYYTAGFALGRLLQGLLVLFGVNVAI